MFFIYETCNRKLGVLCAKITHLILNNSQEKVWQLDTCRKSHMLNFSVQDQDLKIFLTDM